MPDDTLLDLLRRRITADGPITVAQYMEAALTHPRFGYYMGRDPLGQDGDFTTAPEVSQMFGELLGLWCAVTWQQMGSPAALNLVELGPGRGTLMADALRAARLMPGFADALRVQLVEASPTLRDRQRFALETTVPGTEVAWHDNLDTLPQGPMVLLANEFFDALPVRQYQRTAEGWCERLVGLDGDDLVFLLSMPMARVPAIPEALEESPAGSLFEVRPGAEAAAYAIGQHVARFGGAALVIDYGHGRSACGETLQAVKAHKYHDVLADPGLADLTAHVDFQALGEAAREAGARTFELTTQGEFLDRLGLAERARTLLQNATPDQAKEIEAAYRRLIDPEEMGTLFKVLCLAHPDMPPPPGFV
ncbi:MAG: SAM-dependent methyltransferase [Hyphomicrobiales bacterium]|nr:SAM-dependent methyltransferase [Hyphomicrobiales bacterium]MCP5371949.1 SAM-dependent methyltransferase [Hyphomicrobiales bacterium]